MLHVFFCIFLSHEIVKSYVMNIYNNFIGQEKPSPFLGKVRKISMFFTSKVRKNNLILTKSQDRKFSALAMNPVGSWAQILKGGTPVQYVINHPKMTVFC